jgi:hypothetical protein
MSLDNIYLYLDLDGVLANFDKKLAELLNLNLGDLTLREFFEQNPGSKKSLNFWKLTNKHSYKISIFENLEKTLECDLLLQTIKELDFFKINILSATGNIVNASVGKNKWVDNNVKPILNISETLLSKTGATKHLMCSVESGIHVLIDDTPENISNWQSLSNQHVAFLHNKLAPENTILFLRNLCKVK